MNKTILTIALAAIAWSGASLAEPSSLVAFDKQTRALLRNADPARGKALAEEKNCAKCHGEAGISEDSDEANIAGQLASYAFKQLMDFNSGHRENRRMRRRIKDLEASQLADLAVYFASLPTPPAENADKASAETLRLVFKGDPQRMIKPCATCHGRKGLGGKHDSATLVGLRRNYFVATMTAFQQEERVNDIYSRMRSIAAALTDEEIEALADYYAAKDPEDGF